MDIPPLLFTINNVLMMLVCPAEMAEMFKENTMIQIEFDSRINAGTGTN
jgi:hypothetical protein